ncbi:zinc-binding alcohol dehydrogenase family protein [Gordonia sp. PKS22-38]|uniref:Zinc-type alcohol dehydrogenase-like protein n=1 Tax=Gordonia prachuapensis TaxID=3115651 RepID=A0ABU7MTZ4_9ACTN|nr:zinc-binding alcohol dehydrogenase family protein [Gordonia sp. PKS22-38]
MPTTASAIAALAPGPIDADTSFVPVDITVDDPGPHDLLVEVRAVSVNPVDVKVRASFAVDDGPKVLGYDASGVVTAVGSEVTRFAVGDEVYYAGVINRPGSNGALQLVDEHIVGHKPASLTFGEAAALPLTTLTAWEVLFEKLRIEKSSAGSILVVAGAGGVGSMVIQLARTLTDLTIVATASRENSAEWARDLGAHHVIDPRRLRKEASVLVPEGIDYVFSPHSRGNVETYAEIMGVHGQVVAIDEPEGLDTFPLKSKSQSWHWELMFSKALYLPSDDSQHRILEEVARLVDEGTLRTTINHVFAGFTVENLREAHRISESGGAIGKAVVVR